MERGDGIWILTKVGWCADGMGLVVVAQERAQVRLFRIDDVWGFETQFPLALTGDGTVEDFRTLSIDDPRIFVTSSTMLDTSIYSIVIPSQPPFIQHLGSQSLSENTTLSDLS